MRIITKMLKGTCVYWALQSNESGGLAYDDYGQPIYTDPVELRCRWVDKNEEFIDPEGTRHVSKAVVYVESDVDIGGMLFNGVLTDVVNLNDPRSEDDQGARPPD